MSDQATNVGENPTGADVEVKGSPPSIEQYVTRFNKLTATHGAPGDARLPEFQRDRFPVIGRAGERAPGDNQSLAHNSDVNIMYIRCEAGMGFCSHQHSNWEIIIPLSGRWRMTCDTKEAVILEPWDVMMVPGGIYHDAQNISDGEAYLMGLNPGSGQAKFQLHPSVVERLAALKTPVA